MVLMLKELMEKLKINKRISKEQVVYVIKNGANNLKTVYPGGMPPMMLTEDADINAVADYVCWWI